MVIIFPEFFGNPGNSQIFNPGLVIMKLDLVLKTDFKIKEKRTFSAIFQETGIFRKSGKFPDVQPYS